MNVKKRGLSKPWAGMDDALWLSLETGLCTTHDFSSMPISELFKKVDHYDVNTNVNPFIFSLNSEQMTAPCGVYSDLAKSQ